MSKESTPNNIIRFPAESVRRLGFERVKKRKESGSRMEQAGQMSLFSPPATAGVVKLPSALGPFDEALRLDEAGDVAAAAAYESAIEAGDSVADAYCNLGVMKTRAGEKEAAFDCFTHALKRDPRHFESHYNVGNLYLENGHYKPAKLHYEVAAELDPEFPNVYFNLGVVNALNGDYGAAVEALGQYREMCSEEEAAIAENLLHSLRPLVQSNPS